MKFVYINDRYLINISNINYIDYRNKYILIYFNNDDFLTFKDKTVDDFFNFSLFLHNFSIDDDVFYLQEYNL